MKTLSRRIFEEVWNQKNLDVIDELIAPNYVHHDPQNPNVPNGIEGYKQFVQQYLKAFPDLSMKVHDEFVDGNTTITRWTATGTQKGDLPGLARTNKPITIAGITIARTENGKFVESWNNWDALGMMQQLGVGQAA